MKKSKWNLYKLKIIESLLWHENNVGSFSHTTSIGVILWELTGVNFSKLEINSIRSVWFDFISNKPKNQVNTNG